MRKDSSQESTTASRPGIAKGGSGKAEKETKAERVRRAKEEREEYLRRLLEEDSGIA